MAKRKKALVELEYLDECNFLIKCLARREFITKNTKTHLKVEPPDHPTIAVMIVDKHTGLHSTGYKA